MTSTDKPDMASPNPNHTPTLPSQTISPSATPRTRPRSQSTPLSSNTPNGTPTPGAAQFLTNLTPEQIQHLQYKIPATTEPDRFSQFLEGPRQTPVPRRFTFAAVDAESRKASKTNLSESKSTKSSKHGRTKSEIGSHHSGKSRGTSKSGSATLVNKSSWTSSSRKHSVDLFKEVEKMRMTVEEVDWRFYGTGGVICAMNLVAAWDATALSIALPIIASPLNGSAVESFWLGISFLAAATAFLPLFSIFSDIFGRKTMLLTGLTFFTIGSFIAAVAGNFGALHLGRTVQGIGAGGFCMLSDLIVSDLSSAVDRRKWSSALGGVWAIGAVTGPVIGEALAENSQWRWIFWLNLPFCAIAFIVLPFFAKLKQATPGSVMPKLKNVDWLGFALLSGSLVGVLLGLSWGGTLHAWDNFNTLLPIQFGLIGLTAFCIWSWYSPFPSLISLDGFLDRTSLGCYVGSVVQGMIVAAFLYLMPFYFSATRPDLHTTVVGARWLPWTLPLVLFIGITFTLVSRYNCWLLSLWVGWALVTLGVGLTILYSPTSPNSQWIPIAIVLGSGVGVLYPALHTVHELIAGQAQALDHGNGSAIAGDNGKMARRAVTNFMFFQLLGKTLGVGIGPAVFQNQLLKKLEANPLFADFAKRYVRDAVALVVRVHASPEDEIRAAMALSYSESLKYVWIVMTVFAGVALAASAVMMPKEENEWEGDGDGMLERKRAIELKNLRADGYEV